MMLRFFCDKPVFRTSLRLRQTSSADSRRRKKPCRTDSRYLTSTGSFSGSSSIHGFLFLAIKRITHWRQWKWNCSEHGFWL